MANYKEQTVLECITYKYVVCVVCVCVCVCVWCVEHCDLAVLTPALLIKLRNSIKPKLSTWSKGKYSFMQSI